MCVKRERGPASRAHERLFRAGYDWWCDRAVNPHQSLAFMASLCGSKGAHTRPLPLALNRRRLRLHERTLLLLFTLHAADGALVFPSASAARAAYQSGDVALFIVNGRHSLRPMPFPLADRGFLITHTASE